MKKFITYSYTILLVLTCLIAFPYALNEITDNEANPVIVAFKNLINNSDDIPRESGESQASDENKPVESGQDQANNDQGSKNSTVESVNTPDETSESDSEASPGNDNTDVETEESPDPDDNNISYEFTTVSTDYFDDALFIGDSRTIGIYEYGNLKNATFFASNGLNVYDVFDNVIEVPELGSPTLSDLLSQKDFGKIYIMLGINELGYDFNNTIAKYEALVDSIRERLPEAIIYIQANLHVTKSRAESDDIYNNENINKFNLAVSSIADNKDIFYLDVNEIFDDESGDLNPDYTSDNTHVLGKYYLDWCNWIATKAIVK